MKNDSSTDISVASAAVSALNCFVESLFSALDFLVSRLLKLVSFSATVNTCWLTMCNEEDARKCLVLHYVAWSIFSRLPPCLKDLGFLFLRIVESSKVGKPKLLCATDRWFFRPCVIKLKYAHPPRCTRTSSYEIVLSSHSLTNAVSYFLLSNRQDHDTKLDVQGCGINWICNVVDTKSLKVWKQELHWKSPKQKIDCFNILYTISI